MKYAGSGDSDIRLRSELSDIVLMIHFLLLPRILKRLRHIPSIICEIMLSYLSCLW